jgi:hypothetical protein
MICALLSSKGNDSAGKTGRLRQLDRKREFFLSSAKYRR